MQEPELPAWSTERMAGRHKGDHSSLMWCLWLERQVCPRLGGQEGLSAHPGPKSAPSSFEAAVSLWPELLTPGTAVLLCVLPPKFCKTPNEAIEVQIRRTHGSPCKQASLVL